MCTKSKNILLVVFSIIFINSLTAQISIGVQGGLNSAIFKLSNLDPNAKISYNNGIILGSIVNYELNNSFSLQMEPRYIQKGQIGKLKDFAPLEEAELDFHYLEFPIYLVAELSESQLSPFILGGINLGYLIKAKADIVAYGKEETYDITSDYKKFDFAIDLGAGLKYKLDTNTSLLMNVRYSYGIYNLSNMDGSVNTRGIQILLGALYKL